VPSSAGPSLDEFLPATARTPRLRGFAKFIALRRPELVPVWESLSPLAQSGLRAVSQSDLSFSDIAAIMCNPTLSRFGGLEAVAFKLGYLHSRGVVGLADYFSPTKRDKKLAARDPVRINSLIAEIDALIWTCDNTDAAKISIGNSLAVPWSTLTKAQRNYLERLYPELSQREAWTKFRAQHGGIHPDAVVTESQGVVR
jgi:hypothetical protein